MKRALRLVILGLGICLVSNLGAINNECDMDKGDVELLSFFLRPEVSGGRDQYHLVGTNIDGDIEALSYDYYYRILIDLLKEGKEDECIAFLDGSLHSINLRSPFSSFSALHLAVYYNCPKVVWFLLISGANPNALDCDGNTPFNYARYKHSKCNLYDEIEVFSYIMQLLQLYGGFCARNDKYYMNLVR